MAVHLAVYLITRFFQENHYDEIKSEEGRILDDQDIRSTVVGIFKQLVDSSRLRYLYECASLVQVKLYLSRVRSIFILNLIDLKFRLFFNLKNSNHNCLYWSRIILTQNEKSFRYFMWMTTKTIL